ncbi:MAG: glycosyltransferase family 4 protein [Salinispira sp.]
MKIVFIITGLSVGGAETVLLRLLQRINRSRFSVHVVSLGSMGVLGSSIEELGIPVTALGMTPGKLSIPLFIRLVSLLRKIRPDIVQTWMYHADVLGGAAAYLAGVRRILWNIRVVRPGSRTTTAVMKMCAPLSYIIPRKILACAEAVRRSHCAQGYCSRKMQVLPNGVDTEFFHPNNSARAAFRRKLGIHNTTPLVGYVGRFHPNKNIPNFLKHAVSRVLQNNSAAHVALIGSELTHDNLVLQQAMSDFPHERVHLLGPHNAIAAAMSAFDVLALPSHIEGFPNVLLEAMACGVPSVATSTGDSAIIIGNLGRIVEVGDMEGLANSIIEILALPEQERQDIGIKARERIVKEYDIKTMIHKYEKIYESVYTE